MCAVIWFKCSTWTLKKTDVRVNQKSSYIWKVLKAGMCNTSRAELAPKRQFLKGKIYPVASLSFFCLASDRFLFTQKPGTSRHLLKPSLDNSLPDLIWSCIFLTPDCFSAAAASLFPCCFYCILKSVQASLFPMGQDIIVLSLFLYSSSFSSPTLLTHMAKHPLHTSVLLLSCTRDSAGSWT